MKLLEKRPAILGAGLATLYVALHVGLMVGASIRSTEGTFVYPLDDAYIHLSIAKNIAHNHTFGVTADHFASASSSVVWPLVLAGLIAIVGDHTSIPLVVNLGLGLAVPWIVARGLSAARASTPVLLLGPTLVAFAIPLPTIICLGMEHTLHIVAVLAFVPLAASFANRPGRRTPLLLLGFLLTSIRYEAIFPTLALVALLVLRKRRTDALLVSAVGLAPIVMFGAYSMAHGARFLPNSVLLKGRSLALHSATDVVNLLGGDLFDRLSANPHLLVIFGGLGLVWWIHHQNDTAIGRVETDQARLLLFTVACHTVFAGLGWFYRYEAYLVGAGMMLVLRTIPSVPFGRRQAPLALALSIAFLAPIFRRTIVAVGATPAASRNIFQQQWQMGKFLQKFFPNEPVAVNDIGAVAYQRSAPIVDLVGLASISVARAKKFKIDEPLSQADMARETSGVRVAIVYEQWIGASIPPEWVRVGKWRITNLKSPAYADVAIYACQPDAIPVLISALRKFESELPVEVRQEGRYLDPTGDPFAGPYRLHVDDVILVDDSKDTKLRPVLADGSIMVPPAVQVRGLTLEDAQRGVSKVAPNAKISVAERRPYRVFVSGAVAASVELLRSQTLTAAEAAHAAGAKEGSQLTLMRETNAGFTTVPLMPQETLLPGDFVVVAP